MFAGVKQLYCNDTPIGIEVERYAIRNLFALHDRGLGNCFKLTAETALHLSRYLPITAVGIRAR